jgi:HTH-type transcriptional regulator, sugar sensing transcriptional regulator
MIEQPDGIRPELRDLGLSDREARVYLALLGCGEATATQLSLETSIPQNKIYTPLESLQNAGLCRRQRRGGQNVFVAVDPAVSLASPLQMLGQRLDNARLLAEQLHGLYDASKSSYDGIGEVEILTHRAAIRQRYLQLVESAELEVAGFSRGPYAWENMEELTRQFDLGREVGRRCRARWIYEVDSEFENMIVDFLRGYGDDGTVRICRQLPLKMVIFDARTIIFSTDDPRAPEQLSVTIMHHLSIVRAFMTLFEFHWDQAQSITGLLAARQTESS